jgi:hypothetical protein
VLAELAAANAAFAVIKEAVANGKEIYEAGDAVADYFGVKAELQKKAHEHGYKSDMQAFQAAEQLKQYESSLKQMMIWQGRPGLWDDWLAFQKQMKDSREAAEKAEKAKKARRRQLVKDILIGTVVTIGVLTAVGIAVYILYWLITTKGQ